MAEISVHDKSLIYDLVSNSERCKISWVSSITFVSEEDIKENAEFIGLVVVGNEIMLPGKKPSTSAIDISDISSTNVIPKNPVFGVQANPIPLEPKAYRPGFDSAMRSLRKTWINCVGFGVCDLIIVGVLIFMGLWWIALIILGVLLLGFILWLIPALSSSVVLYEDKIVHSFLFGRRIIHYNEIVNIAVEQRDSVLKKGMVEKRSSFACITHYYSTRLSKNGFKEI